MINENKINEIRTAFDKVVDEWDMDRLSSPRLVQMALSAENQIASFSK